MLNIKPLHFPQKNLKNNTNNALTWFDTMITNKALLCEFTATLRQMAWNSTNTAWKTKRIKANSYKWLCIYDLKQHILWCGPLLTYILVHIPRDKLDWPLAYMLHLASCWLSFGCHMITLFGLFHHSSCFFTHHPSPRGLSSGPLGLLASSLKMPKEIHCLILFKRGVAGDNNKVREP